MVPTLPSQILTSLDTSLLSKFQLGRSGCSSSSISSCFCSSCSFSCLGSSSCSSCSLCSRIINLLALPAKIPKARDKSISNGLFQLSSPEDSYIVGLVSILEQYWQVVGHCLTRDSQD